MEKPHDKDDLYSGFDEFDFAISTESVDASATGRSASSVLRSSATSWGGQRLPTGMTRFLSAAKAKTPTRPSTAVRSAGYTSQGRVSSYDANAAGVAFLEKKVDETPEERCKKLEKKVNEKLEESLKAHEKGDYLQALSSAKEAVREERAVVKHREQFSLIDQINVDLTFLVLFNLAYQYSANNMQTEAISTYQAIYKNKMFTKAGELKVNIGNIYFQKGQYGKAISYYQAALDHVQSSQKYTRRRIMNNIGLAYIKMKRYEDALSIFEPCTEAKLDFNIGLNFIVCARALNYRGKMKIGFQYLLEIPLEMDDDEKYTSRSDDQLTAITLETIKHDPLRMWEKERRELAEKTILTATNIISPCIASTFAEGYNWCMEKIRQSIYAEIADHLEINQALLHMKKKDLNSAVEILKTCEKKESKVASVASNNLSFIYFLQGSYDKAKFYADKTLSSDKYNPDALINRGNVAYAQGQYSEARDYYQTAWSSESTSFRALYNMGLACEKMNQYDMALDCFNKLRIMLPHNAQIMCSIARTYETVEDLEQAIEWYVQASCVVPSDPFILAKIADLYDREGDKPQALQYYNESCDIYPSCLSVLEWLGSYYMDVQFCEKAVQYYERAAFLRPDDVKWQLMIAACHRQSGNYQTALELYKKINAKFPDNVECIKYIVRMCKDMDLPEAADYQRKLKRAERVRQFRDQQTNPVKNQPKTKSGTDIFRTPTSSAGSDRHQIGSPIQIMAENDTREDVNLFSNDETIDDLLPE